MGHAQRLNAHSYSCKIVVTLRLSQLDEHRNLSARSDLGRPHAPLVVPELEAALVQANRSPIVGAQQAHQVGSPDPGATGVARLAETVTAPKLDRVVARKAAIPESLSNVLASEVASHYAVHAGRSSTGYSITRSARPNTDGGIVSPRALAVFMLITSSNV